MIGRAGVGVGVWGFVEGVGVCGDGISFHFGSPAYFGKICGNETKHVFEKAK